jgi:hypothetical protein
MVQILLLSTPPLTVRCNGCGAVLTYAPEDVQDSSYVRSGRWYRETYVECPSSLDSHHAVLTEEWEGA